MIEVQDLGYWRLKALLYIGGTGFSNLISEYMRRGARIKELEQANRNCWDEVERKSVALRESQERVAELFGVIGGHQARIKELEANVDVPFTTRLTKERN